MRILQLLGVLLSGATLANAAVTPISVWFDSSCAQKVQGAYQEALQYATKGNAAQGSTDTKYQNLYSWIFGSGSRATVQGKLSAPTTPDLAVAEYVY